ncbi:DUF2795 domain-containing protein [Nocardia sp. CDC160]|uniref:DUF2795 domain-containing protein n=1 Tax=Nocardia sp. CDC160 TaxID=3112166 RepID=UPI002DBCA76B|nr:DUF2795 domain-containing protein [Nocardia sp. CDC160]MEC3918990.1 DUF2795 domain-containing protein [Nocardia sp. CDC160]
MATINPIQLQKYLRGTDYPCKRDELVRIARDNGADATTLERLQQIPDRNYEGPQAVSRAVAH